MNKQFFFVYSREKTQKMVRDITFNYASVNRNIKIGKSTIQQRVSSVFDGTLRDVNQELVAITPKTASVICCGGVRGIWKIKIKIAHDH